MSGAIRADAARSFDALAQRLAVKAAELARSAAAANLLARRGNPSRWRHAGLLWPLFTKG